MPNHETLIPSLGAYDLVGFQTDGDAANFARYLAKELGTPSHISLRLGSGDRAMRIGTFPVGIETRNFTRLARRAVKTKFVQQVLASIPGALMIGVDRLDYSKGISSRLEAYERFLAARPEWHDKITYLQITPKSRSQIKEYAQMEQEVNSISGRINGAYSDASWAPVRYVNRPYSRTALAGLYSAARVGLVTPMRDGMNLVAKEYVAAQDAQDPGVLILSRFAGAADEMGAALLVNPYDPDAVGAAIARAVAMPLAERKERHAELYAALLRNDISRWGDKFLKALGKGEMDQGREAQAFSDFIAGPTSVATVPTRPPATRQ
jgi:trehalose 6-phosphate synthase